MFSSSTLDRRGSSTGTDTSVQRIGPSEVSSRDEVIASRSVSTPPQQTKPRSGLHEAPRHKATNVSVLSNIIRLCAAYSRRAWSTLRRWRRVQNMTKQVLQSRSTENVRWSADAALPAQAGDRLFMSFHYGLWYMS